MSYAASITPGGCEQQADGRGPFCHLVPAYPAAARLLPALAVAWAHRARDGAAPGGLFFFDAVVHGLNVRFDSAPVYGTRKSLKPFALGGSLL